MRRIRSSGLWCRRTEPIIYLQTRARPVFGSPAVQSPEPNRSWQGTDVRTDNTRSSGHVKRPQVGSPIPITDPPLNGDNPGEDRTLCCLLRDPLKTRALS